MGGVFLEPSMLRRFTVWKPKHHYQATAKERSVRRPLQSQSSYTFDEIPEDLDSASMEKALKKFREGGGRYEYSKECRNHFDIKYW